MDYYYYRKHVNPYYDYDYYRYRRYPYRWYPYYRRYNGIYGSNISNINQSLINSGYMSDVYQNAYVNQIR